MLLLASLLLYPGFGGQTTAEQQTHQSFSIIEPWFEPAGMLQLIHAVGLGG